jgi:glycosyltransferase involved in cell wall biosynthesis
MSEPLKFSVIIPVYNRPQEVKELLQSLVEQTYKTFEVLIIEDGSEDSCTEICKRFGEQLDLKYFYKENSGPGLSRNYGFEQATGEFFIIFDSDCLIPAGYLHHLSSVLKTKNPPDAYGGPDAASPDFSSMQKAVSYAMTSTLTTGGIRGKKKHIGQFSPRSFNMGISKKVWKETGGFSAMRYGEDIEFSRRMINSGYKVVLIPELEVYHKRRTNLKQFFNQVRHSGEARIKLYSLFPSELKLGHWFPAVFTLGFLLLLTAVWWLSVELFVIGLSLYFGYLLLNFLNAFVVYKSFTAAILTVPAILAMHFGYGIGFIKEGIKYLLKSGNYGLSTR